MNEYEKYRLQWMLDHDYSLPDLLERLSDIAMNENLDEIQNPRVMLNEAFERLEYEQGFDNEEIWLCKDEWEHDLYSSNEYSLTDAGKTKVKQKRNIAPFLQRNVNISKMRLKPIILEIQSILHFMMSKGMNITI